MAGFSVFCFVLFLTFPFAQAQAVYKPGYVVQVNGDSLTGYIDAVGDVQAAKAVSFKSSLTAVEMIYKPRDIQGYGYEKGKHYTAHRISTDKGEEELFLEVIAGGPVTLYYWKESGAREHFFIRKGTEPLHELTMEVKRVKAEGGKRYDRYTKTYLGTLASHMSDCGSIHKSLQKTAFRETALVKLVDKYNNCVAPQEKHFKKETPSLKVRAGLMVGAANVQLMMKGSDIADAYLGEYSPSGSLTGGLSLDLTSPRVREWLALHVGLLYKSYKTEAESVGRSSVGGRAEHHVRFDASYLSVPLMLRYTYPKGKVRPFINAGPSIGFLLRMEGYRHSLYYVGSNSSWEREGPAMEKYKNYELGVTGGIGAVVSLPGRLNLLTELRHERSNGFSAILAAGSRVNTTSLLVGILF